MLRAAIAAAMAGAALCGCACAEACALDRLTLPVSGQILLRFEARYVAAGRPCTHHGIDIAGDAGDPVAASCAGTVRFAGQVPSDAGGRVGAVTIESPSGELVTVLPLAEVRVSPGARVSCGEAVGGLAATGDASSGEPHVHLSVRVEGRYVDPEPLLVRAEMESGSARAAAPPCPPDPLKADAGVSRVEAAEVPAGTTVVRVLDAPRMAGQPHRTPQPVDAQMLGSAAAQATGLSDAGRVRGCVFRSISGMRAASASGAFRRPYAAAPQPSSSSAGCPPVPKPTSAAWLCGLGAAAAGVASVRRGRVWAVRRAE